LGHENQGADEVGNGQKKTEKRDVPISIQKSNPVPEKQLAVFKSLKMWKKNTHLYHCA
jgi:hypothetical protein